jgi:UDPglucose 6-dehydrogenase
VYFEILSNPEFLAAGTAMADLLNPDRILIGSSVTISGQQASKALADVYATWVPRQRIITTNIWSSELAKLVANSMLAQRISSINSISAICEKTGADITEIATSIGCDPRIGSKFLKAGIGFGGSCFKKDTLSLIYLAESLGLEEVGDYWRQVVTMNEYQLGRFSKRVIKTLNNTLIGKKVTVLGYAFKADTSDTRESPALEIIETLLQEGPKEIAIFDPCCNPAVIRNEIKMLLQGQLKADGGPIVVYDNPYQACAACHAVLITTEFEEFRMDTSKPPSLGRPRAGSVDPRPFDLQDSPSQSEVLALHQYLLESSTCLAGSDPLQLYVKEPLCAYDCPDCCPGQGYDSAGYSLSKHKARERLDWNKIAEHLQKPKWIFDGRGVTNINALKKLGVNVESVGRQGNMKF